MLIMSTLLCLCILGNSDDVNKQWLPQVEYFGYKEYAELRYVHRTLATYLKCNYRTNVPLNVCIYCVYFCRISELFDILVEYPDSEPALCDLKQCMEKVNLRAFLISSLKSV